MNRQPKIQRTPACSIRRFGNFQHQVIEMMAAQIPGIQTKRWRDAVYAAFVGSPEVVHVEDDFRQLLDDLAFIPDAFVANTEELRVDFFEVEVTSPMSHNKLRSYAKFVTDMDYYGIAFEVYTVNQHGHINRVDLQPYYVEWLREVSAV